MHYLVFFCGLHHILKDWKIILKHLTRSSLEKLYVTGYMNYNYNDQMTVDMDFMQSFRKSWQKFRKIRVSQVFLNQFKTVYLQGPHT